MAAGKQAGYAMCLPCENGCGTRHADKFYKKPGAAMHGRAGAGGDRARVPDHGGPDRLIRKPGEGGG